MTARKGVVWYICCTLCTDEACYGGEYTSAGKGALVNGAPAVCDRPNPSVLKKKEDVMAPTVDQIKKEVHDAIYWDARLDSSRIHVVIANGAVTVTGTIPNPAIHTIIQTDVLSVPGVLTIRDETVVESAEGQISDDEIQTHIRNALRFNSSIAAKEIDVDVHDGLVILRGTVNALWKKRRSEEIACETAGVKAVHNELAVAPDRSREDKEIARAVMGALERNSDVTAEKLDIEVSDGAVVVRGRVENARKFMAIRKAAELTSGVANVHYDVRVGKPSE